MEKRNRYRHSIHPVTIFRIVLLSVLALAAGSAFVLVRNQHVIDGDKIREYEQKIAVLDQEIELWELRIAGVEDRQEMSRRLRWAQSDLATIEPTRLIDGREVNTTITPVVSAF
jgi:hypothetical protein